MDRLLAACAPGLERFTAVELQRLGLSAGAAEAGGLGFQGSLRDVYRANLHLRSANRVLLRFGEFRASRFPKLRRKAGDLPWEKYLPPGRPIAFRVGCERSRLYHEGAVAERLAGAIADRLGKLSPVRKCSEDSIVDPPQLVFVRLADNLCTISLDSSGAPLHRRGYRLATAKAPLKETLACALVLASGWDAASPLLDPFCGSGTIPIEAALLARRIAPGRARRFAFMDWPGFDSKSWDELSAQAAGEIVTDIPKIIASDRDAGAIRAAQANAERAGVAGCIEFSCKAVSAIEPPPSPGWVVTNPPYGTRLKTADDVRNLYAQFGKVLRAKCPAWHVSLLCDSGQLVGNIGLGFDQGIATLNGGLKVKLVSGLVPAAAQPRRA